MERDTIFVVDDDQDDIAAIRGALSDDYVVLEANDDASSLAIMERLLDRLQLIILDTSSPYFDGMGLLSDMRSRGWLKSVIVIMVTSDETREPQSRLLSFGMKHVITRPFDEVAVKDCVENALRGRSDVPAAKTIIVETEKQKNLLTYSNVFLYEYDHATGISHIDARYKNYLRGDWGVFKLDNPELVKSAIYRPDYEKFTDFLSSDAPESYMTVDVRLLTVAGGFEWFRIEKMHYEDEHDVHTVLAFRDASSEMQAREKLDFLSHSDRLTQIPNLQAFLHNTAQMFEEHPDEPFIMIRTGIERFAILNQIYGRNEGDRLLRYIAVKLQETIESESSGTYCRIGADNFVACIPDHEGNAASMMSVLQESLRAYPINFEIALNFGLYRVDDRTVRIDEMIDRAATAQKTIKGNYSRHFAAYDAALREQDENERMIVLNMHDALNNAQFEMFLQPKCDMRTGDIIGSEALVRWIHPSRGMISPGAFIPLFEKSGFITEIDRLILREACSTLRKWLDEGLAALPISINISRADLYNPHLLDDILDVTEQYEIPHELLGLEFTESSFVFDNSVVAELTELLKQNGFCVLLDDFGSGYSSLNALKDIYVNILKMDLRFLHSSEDTERANSILCSVCKMAQDIGLDIIVEGVETADQANLLMSIGVNCAQGFYYYRPMPVEDYEHELRKQMLRDE